MRLVITGLFCVFCLELFAQRRGRVSAQLEVFTKIVNEETIEDQIRLLAKSMPFEFRPLLSPTKAFLTRFLVPMGGNVTMGRNTLTYEPIQLGFQARTIPSPMDGVILWQVDEGRVVEEGQVLAFVVKPHKTRLEWNMSRDQRDRVAMGTEISPDNLGRGDKAPRWTAKIDSIGGVPDPITQSYRVSASLICDKPASCQAPLPFSTESILVKTNPRRGFLIPRQALDEKDPFLFRVVSKKAEDGSESLVAEKIVVEIKNNQGADYEVVSPALKNGDKVITSSNRVPKEGEVVVVLREE